MTSSTERLEKRYDPVATRKEIAVLLMCVVLVVFIGLLFSVDS